MTEYTVEVTVEAPAGGDFSYLRTMLDIVPGTVLLEYPDEPALVFPVEAENPMKAATFIDGIAKLTGLEIKAGVIRPAETLDDDWLEEDESKPTEATDRVRLWMEQIPDLPGHVDSRGRLVGA